MRNVLVGAGAVVVLGMITLMVSWSVRWADQWKRSKLTPDHTVLQKNSSIDNITVQDSLLTFRPVKNQSHFSDSDDSSNVNRSFNDNSSTNIPTVNWTIGHDSSGSPISVNSSTSRPSADVSHARSTTEGSTTTGFFNESTGLNSSSLLPENNGTEISFGLEDSNRNSSSPTNSTEDDVDYVKMGQELLTEATTILDTGIWDFEKRTEDGDAIFSRQLDNGNMVYRLTGIVDMPPQDLLVIIWDGLADYPKWNPSLLECRVLEKINDQTDISYTVSAPGARGYVASRDFVSLRHWELRHNTYIAASKSLDFPGAPSNSDYIRGKNGPGCMELRPLSSDLTKTEFRWLLNTKLNGWIPSYIADKAYKKFMMKYMIFLREYCKKIKQRVILATTTPKNITE